jgi:hypothetical protein
MRDAAISLRLSLHQVRREMGIIDALIAEARRPPRAPAQGIALAPRQAARRVLAAPERTTGWASP